MFTGIVEERGRVVARRDSRLVIEAGATREGTDLGSSLAVNGV
jgi:riboflavin synthase alpha subunit